MPLVWKPFDVPMGVGLETKSSPFDAPLGATTIDYNTEFTRTGGRAKREGFNSFLGNVPNACNIVRHGDHLLSFARGGVYDYSPALAAMKQVSSNYLPTNVRSQIVKTSNSAITSTDTYSLGGFACTAYVDALGVHAKIIDLNTNTVVSTQDILLFSTTLLANTALTVCAQFTSGNVVFYVFFGGGENNAPVRWKTAQQSGSTFNWSTSQSFSWGASGLLQNLASAPVPGTANVVCFAAATTASALLKINTSGVVLSNTALTGVHSGSPAALTLNQAASTWWTAWTSSGGDLWVSLWLDSNFTAGPSGAVVTGVLPAHVTMVARNGSSNMTILYDDSTYVGTTSARVWSGVLNAALSYVTLPAILYYSASLSSHAIEKPYVGTTREVYFLISYRSSASNTISGINFNQTQQNCVTLLATLDHLLLVGRVFRGQALKQANTPSASSAVAVDGNIVFGSLALVASDYTTLQNATTLGAAAIVTANTQATPTRGFSVLQDFFTPGGMPSTYDGASIAETGFNVFPECLGIWAGNDFAKSGGFINHANNTGAPSNMINRANSTAYVVGTRMRGSSTGLAANVGWGHIYVCVHAGKTAASTAGLSWSTTGGITQDGDCIWQDAGLEVPERKWAVGLTNAQMAVGTCFIPSVSNGYLYVVTVAGAGNTAGAEPTWPTIQGTTVNGSGDGYTYMCVGTITNMTGTANGFTYAYAFTYEWVDDQGLLWMSSPSPIVSGITLSSDLTNDNVLFVVSTLRLTNKKNVRIGVYRTTGNGTILKKIMLVAAPSGVDAVAIVDTISDTTGDTGMPLYTSTLGAGELPNVPPPACSCAALWGQRVVTNNLEDPYAIWPSKLISLQSIYDSTPAWSDELVIQMDASFGKVVAIQQMDDKLVVFQERRICILTGDGPDNTGGGVGFLEPQPIATDVGCNNPNSIVSTTLGLFFQSPKGIYLLTRNLTTEFIGSPIIGVLPSGFSIDAAFNHPTKPIVLFVESVNGYVHAYDYLVGQWSTWPVNTGTGGPISGATYGNSAVLLDPGGDVRMQASGVYLDADNTNYGVDFLVGPILLATDLAYVRVRSAQFQVQAAGSPVFDVAVYENGSSSAAYTQASPLVGADQDSFETPLVNQKLKRVAFRVTETTPGNAVLFEAMSLLIGVFDKNYRLPATKRTV